MEATHSQTALVGRVVELRRLEEMLETLPGGPARIVQLVGEPGIGKTRLVEELLGAARARGYLAVSGRASEFERDVPFAALADALAAPELRLEQVLERLPSGYRRELGSVLPALGGGEQPPGAPLPTTERYQLHRAFAALFEALAEETPLVLALDDLHWADGASIEVLLHLLERPPAAPLLLALAYRPRQLPPGLGRGLAGAAQQGARFELAPLSWEQAARLLPRELSAEVGRRLFRESAGNPFYLEQLLRAASQGKLPRGGPLGARADGAVPSAVVDTTEREVATLGGTARRVLEGAAVAGDPFEPELAAAAAELGPDEALAALDDLVARDLVRATERRGRLRFRHPLVHQAIYEQTRASWRLAAHARVAAALAARGAPAAVRAQHVERYARTGDSEAIAVLEQAAQAATLRAPLTAARWYRGALELLADEPPQAERRRQLLAGRAITLGFAGRLAEASEAFRRLLGELPPDSAERSTMVRFAALVEHLLGNHGEAEGLVLRQLERLPRDAPEARQLEVELAYGGFIAADWEAVRRWASAALAGELSEAVRAAALSLVALAQYSLGETADARRSAEGARGLVDGLEDVQLLERLEAMPALAWAEFCLEQVDHSLAHAGRGIRISQEHGQGHLIVAMQVVQALGLLLKGAFGRAADVAQDAIESSRLSGNNLFLTWALTTRCDAELQAGDPRRAVAFGEQAQRPAAESRSPWATVAPLYLAEARLEAGEPERCLESILDSRGRPRFPPFPYYAPRFLEVLTHAELELGRPERAREWAARATEAAERIGLPGARAVARRCAAELALAEGEHERGLALAREGTALAEEARLPVEAARSRLLAGRALAVGDRDQASVELRRAYDELAAHGASRYRDQAAGALGRLGRAVPRQPRAVMGEGLAELSERERQVAELVAEGRSNRQIAEQLDLSPKTIANHLNRMFTRLGLGSRAELAALVERSRHP
jgi:DNA-binding CsgD family transcriptional regulator